MKIVSSILLLSLVSTLVQCQVSGGQTTTSEDQEIKNTSVKNKVEKTDAEWREILTPEQYRVLREKGTERPFTGVYDKHFESGIYTCAACNHPLFESVTKFDAGCGWPSFSEVLADSSVITHTDKSHGMIRTEVVCANCGGHLGHVFDDGPAPTNLRYCMNSVSLNFEAKE